MDINRFVNLTSRAWAVPILSQLHLGIAGRQAPLLAATGASRTAFAQSVSHLISLSLLERNPGHAHPLRPEFRLTPLGIKAAALANKIQGVTTKADQETLRLSWTLPVLTTLYHAQHFNQIKCHLNPVSDRALSKMLILLGDKNWVRRSVDDTARPPRSQYRVVNKGRNICYTIAPHISFA